VRAGDLHAIAEVPERDAPPEIAALYAEIRAALEMPLVNLIYRHFATHPGFLPWAWGVARPLADAGVLQALAGRLRDAVRQHVAPHTPALPQHGLDAAAVQAVHRLVEFYNRGNSMNVLVMKVLLRALDAPPGTDAPAPVRAAPRAAPSLAEVPPIPAVESLNEADRALVAELNSYGEPGEPGALASLYRHAALWSGCLALWRAMLAPLEQKGVLDGARRFTAERASVLAAELELPATAAPPSVEPRLRATIEGFSSVTICKMIPIGLLLAPAFGGGRARGV
jgi:hypothetical protein